MNLLELQRRMAEDVSRPLTARFRDAKARRKVVRAQILPPAISGPITGSVIRTTGDLQPAVLVSPDQSGLRGLSGSQRRPWAEAIRCFDPGLSW